MEKEKIYRDAATMLFTIAGLGIASGMVLAYALPGYWFPLYPLVPVYFMLLAVAVTAVVSHAPHDGDARRTINRIVLLRGLKLMLSIVFIILYVWLSGVNNGSFLTVFMLFYLVFMGLEVYVFNRYNKTLKTKGTDEKK